MTLSAVATLVLAYLAGSIPFGLLAGWCAGVDIRRHGSGNIGATNVLRVCGAKVGGPVFFLDALKGYLPTAFFPVWIASDGGGALAVGAGIAAVLGHNFPVWLRFRGGKGVATSAGVLFALMPEVVGIALAAFAVTLWLWRYVSLSSTIAAGVMLLARHLVAEGPYAGPALPVTVLCWIMFALVVVRHRANYARLLAGTESRIGARGAAPAHAVTATPPSGDVSRGPAADAEQP